MDELRLPQMRDCQLTIEGRVARLTLNRHDVRNELSGTAIADDIEGLVDWVNRGADISALVITGAGSAFSAGGNVKHMRDRTGICAGDVHEIQNAFRHGIQRIALALHRLEVPCIAAVNGPAIGAGMDLSLMCDIRLASQLALFGETFVNLGLVPGDGGAWFLQRVVGYQRAAELTFTGRLFDAEEALHLGVVLEVLPPEALVDRAMELAQEIASKPPRTVRLTKRLFKTAERFELPDFLDQCAAYQGMSMRSDDHLEAVKAFLEKRTASYRGQ